MDPGSGIRPSGMTPENGCDLERETMVPSPDVHHQNFLPFCRHCRTCSGNPEPQAQDVTSAWMPGNHVRA